MQRGIRFKLAQSSTAEFLFVLLDRLRVQLYMALTGTEKQHLNIVSLESTSRYILCLAIYVFRINVSKYFHYK